MTTTFEQEIKLRYENPESARAAVIAAAATPLRERRLQDDRLLDTADAQLFRRGCALRVRTEAGRSLLTFKGPLQPSALKLREELETIVGDGALVVRLFQELGFRVWFRYQKYREEFRLDEAILAIDETPVGTYIEIEGSERGIAAAAQILGRTPADYVVDSYRSLFVRHCEERGLPVTDMLFPVT